MLKHYDGKIEYRPTGHRFDIADIDYKIREDNSPGSLFWEKVKVKMGRWVNEQFCRDNPALFKMEVE